MARYTKRKKKYSRRGRRKNSYTRKRYAGVNALSTPLPDKLRTTLKYVDTVTLNPGAGGIHDTMIFRVNSAYDPDYTNVGHQPRGFDQLMGLYSRWEVLGAMIRIKFNNRDNSYAQRVSLSLHNGVSIPSFINDYIESGNCRYALLGTESGGKSQATLSMKVNPSKYLGVRNRTATLRGTSGTNPADVAYWHIDAAPTQAVDSAPIDCVVEIHYITEFTEPIKLAQS